MNPILKYLKNVFAAKRILGDDTDLSGLVKADFLLQQLVKEEKEGKIGDLFKRYQEEGGKLSYKTFQRTIAKLANGGFVVKDTQLGGAKGSTSTIRINDVSTVEEKPVSTTDEFGSAAELVVEKEEKKQGQNTLENF